MRLFYVFRSSWLRVKVRGVFRTKTKQAQWPFVMDAPSGDYASTSPKRNGRSQGKKMGMFRDLASNVLRKGMSMKV